MGTPDKLYKYSSLTPRVLQQLCLGEIYYADPSDFNDPLDCRPSVEPDLPIQDLKDVLARLISRRVSKEVFDAMKRLRFKKETILVRQDLVAAKSVETLLQSIEYDATNPDVEDAEGHIKFSLGNAIEAELRSAYDQGVLCLSSKYTSPLMWSHYADQHRGICVELDVSKLPAGAIYKVEYGTSRRLNASAIRRWLGNDDPLAKREIDRACLLTKSTEWNYEDEFRLLGRIGVQTCMAPFRSVTFGMRCDSALQYAVIAALGGANSKLDFYQIAKPTAQFVLHRDSVNVEETLAGMPRVNIIEDFAVLEDVPSGPSPSESS
jgi:hypothetical protein